MDGDEDRGVQGAPEDPDVPAPDESFREALRAAVSKAGIGQVAPGEVPTGSSLLRAVGGVRGLIEAILPAFGFLIVFAITREVLPSVIAPVVLAFVFVIIRLATRTPLTQAFAGVIGIVLSAGLALLTGRAEDNFVLGLIINASAVFVLLVSVIVRWPIIGLFVGILTNELTEWRKDRAKRRVLTVSTWLWLGLFSLRLAVEAPLYFAGHTEVLAAMKLLLGVPLYAAMLWVTWLLVTSVYRRAGESVQRSAQE